MTKPRADKGKKQEKAPIEADVEPDGQMLVEDGGLAASANKQDDVEPSNILSAIRGLQNRMDERFNTLEASLSVTQASVTSLAARVKEIEQAGCDYDHRITEVEQALIKLRTENEQLRHKVVDLEARSRRHNIKIVGLPEKAENGQMEDFLSKFIPELLGPDKFAKPVKVDRAHRLGSRVPGEGGRPRVVIARIHHYNIKEKILQLARLAFPLFHSGKPIFFFPDFPAEVVKKRQVYGDVRKRLLALGAQCGFLYPARLRVSHGSTVKVFSSPHDAETYADTLEND